MSHDLTSQLLDDTFSSLILTVWNGFCLQGWTFLSETWGLERPSHRTWPHTGLTWGCRTATTPSAWARTRTPRPTASCRRSTRSDYGAAATPSRDGARACPAEQTPTWPSLTRSTRTQKTVGRRPLLPVSKVIWCLALGDCLDRYSREKHKARSFRLSWKNPQTG